jgi:hypothetical protein
MGMVGGSSDVVVPPFSVRPYDKGEFMFRTISTTALVAAAVLTAPAPAHAADPTTADCLGASESSISLRNEHKLRAARAQLLVCAAPNCPADIRTECTRRVAEVNAAIPTIVFEVKDTSANDVSAVKVSMDGQLLAERLEGTSLSIDPGVHVFTFESAGQAKVEKQLVIRQGEKDRRERITVGGAASTTPPAAAAPQAAPTTAETTAPPVTTTPTEPSSLQSGQPSRLGTQKIAAIVAAGVGVVGVGIGAVFGLQSMSKHNDASNACPDKCTDQSGVDLWNSARSAGNVSTAAFIVGGVGLTAGAALWFTAKPSASTQVGIGPGSIELKGSW